MKFKSVIGQKGVRDQLIRSTMENRVSHALMFHGPEGSGKFPLALSFAQYLVCSDPGNEDSCGVCPSCQKAEKNIHPDIHFVFPVASLRSITKPVSDHFIQDWRKYLDSCTYTDLQSWLSFVNVENKQASIFVHEAESILRKLQLKSFESDRKVVVIWLPEKMNITAANKLLKIIEEPPDKTFFLMVTQSTDDIIPTILSRTQLVKVNKINERDLEQCLLENFPEKGDVIHGVARLANGNYIQALDLLQSNEQNKLYFEHFVLWMRYAYGFRIAELLEWIPKISQLGREKQKEFLLYCLHMIKGNFHMNRGMMEIMRLSPEEKGFSERFNQFVNPGNIDKLSHLFSEAIAQIGMNANPRILFLDMSTKLYRLFRKPFPKQ